MKLFKKRKPKTDSSKTFIKDLIEESNKAIKFSKLLKEGTATIEAEAHDYYMDALETALSIYAKGLSKPTKDIAMRRAYRDRQMELQDALTIFKSITPI
jgi:hypothetical protein